MIGGLGRAGVMVVGCGIRHGRQIASAAIVIATTLSAAVGSTGLAIVAATVAGKIGFAAAGVRIGVREINPRNTVVAIILGAAFGSGNFSELAGRGAEIRENGLLLNLTLAQCGEIVGYSFFFVESDLTRVGAYKTLVEDATGKLVKVFVFESAQQAGADFSRVGDRVEGDAALLTLFAKFFPERAHVCSGGRD